MGIGENNQFADAFEDCRLPQERAKVALQLKHLVTPAGMGETFHVLVASKAVDGNQFRIIWKSETFPTLAMTYAYDLKPELQDKIRKCFADFQFPDSMKKEYPGMDRFMPITYKETWKPLRDVADKSGTPYNKAAYEAQQKRDAEAAAKKAAEEAAKKAAEQPKQ